jgi:hypothetical protein
MTRQEHMEWCKKRALKYVEMDDLNNALISMMSDLTKHEETKNHLGIQLTTMLMFRGMLKTKQEIINHIMGFN